jgi:hypothetical protein
LTVALVLGALLAAACVLLAAWPFLREPEAADDELGRLSGSALRRLELAEQRDRALAALKELEFDHRTGKVTDEDYRSLLGPLRRQAADALRAFDRLDAPESAGSSSGKVSPTTHTFAGREGRPTP